MSRALIIGGAGFVGSRLARRLLDRGDEVHLLVRPTTSLWRIERFLDRLTIHIAEGGDLELLSRIFAAARADIVYYLARTARGAEPPLKEADALAHSAVGGLIRILRAAEAAPPRVLVRAGTIAEYGDAGYPNDESVRERPVTVYGAAMLAGTHILSALAPSLPYRVANGRLALIYGPQQSTEFLIPLIVEKCLAGEPVTINDPDSSRDFIYVDDAVRGLIALAEMTTASADPINLGSGRPITMQQAADIIVKAAEAPPSLIRRGEPSSAAGAKKLLLTTERARTLAGWRASIPFEEGISRMLHEIQSGQE
jgi:nucleoside-diphosphate-sugar epimerase